MHALGIVIFSVLYLLVSSSHHHHHHKHHHKHDHKQQQQQQQEPLRELPQQVAESEAACSLETKQRCESTNDCSEMSKCSRQVLLNGRAHTHGTCVCELGFCADASGACKRRNTDVKHRVSLLDQRPPSSVTSRIDLDAAEPTAEASYVDASEIKATLRKHVAWCIAVAFVSFLVVAFLVMWCFGHHPHVLYEKVVYHLRVTRRRHRHLTSEEQMTVDRPTRSLQATSEPAHEIRVTRDPETKKFHAQLLVGDEYFKGPGRQDYLVADGDLRKFLRTYHVASEGKEREALRKAVVQLQKGGR